MDRNQNNQDLSSLRLLKTVTLTEAASNIEIHNDDRTNALKLKMANFIIKVPAATSLQTTVCQINGKNTGVYTSGATAGASGAYIGSVDTSFSIMKIDIHCIDGDVLFCSQLQRSSTTTPANSYVNAALVGQSIAALTQFYFYNSNSVQFPIGTIIELWGVNA